MIERETEAMNAHYANLKVEIEELVKEGERLQLLFAKRDELLGECCGPYFTVREYVCGRLMCVKRGLPGEARTTKL